MKNLLKRMFCFSLMMIAGLFVACGNNSNKVAEKITLAKTILSEVEFENSDKVKLKQEENEVKITGEIEAMSDAQKSAYGVSGVTHTVVVKFEFDKEKTIDSFKIEGDVTKVYSTDKNDEFYVGSISSLLDNESSDDAFCYLILSANTKSYTLTASYSDSTKSEIKLTIDANLVTAKTED